MRRLPILAALPLLIGFGVAEGIWTSRWQPSGESEKAAARLVNVPLSVGDWQAEAQDMDPREAAKAEISGYLLRRYVHRASGNSVRVLIVCGRPGPVSLHTPDVCYAGIGYRIEGEPAQQTVKAGPAASASFWTARFEGPGAGIPDRIRIHWAWTAAGDWVAAESPRFHFARAGALYKLYVIEQVESAEGTAEQDQLGTRFIEEFLPQLQQTLFAPAEADNA